MVTWVFWPTLWSRVPETSALLKLDTLSKQKYPYSTAIASPRFTCSAPPYTSVVRGTCCFSLTAVTSRLENNGSSCIAAVVQCSTHPRTQLRSGYRQLWRIEIPSIRAEPTNGTIALHSHHRAKALQSWRGCQRYEERSKRVPTIRTGVLVPSVSNE